MISTQSIHRCARVLARGALASGALAAAPALGAPASALASGAAQAASVSTNWAGYVAVPSTAAGARFRRVLGTWVEPSASCTAAHPTYSAVWVGLGGYSSGSKALEQVGTDADCTRSGGAVYDSWYELLPAAPVQLKLRVHAGDSMAASVTIEGRAVRLTIRDLTTGADVSTLKRPATLDGSSAEWIVEAPSDCASAEACEVLALTDFGQTQFSSALASAGSRTAAVGDWRATALELQQRAFAHARVRGGGASALPTAALTVAAPSEATAPYGAFSVSWSEQSLALERPSAPTLPGFEGGPPVG
ncbi:MAG TPA: G1 family glutamic endopeptidase [Solirubrobacteraceae bacterium]|nr:G1 family glutamic endopeptidase [Solirubrobacteraceae bacterium]